MKTLGIALAILASAALDARGADNLIMNGGFEAGIQSWKSDGKIVRLAEGNRVCEIDAAKNRLKDITQEFRMKDLQQVEVVFRARSLKYTGPGLRVSIHQVGGGSVLWNRALPEDGSWTDIRILYTRASKEDRRELIFATLLGTGKVQIDDVEMRPPSRVGEASAAPASTPIPSKPSPPMPAAPEPVRPATPPGTFGSFEQIVQSVPAAVLKKLADNPDDESATSEVNAFLSENMKGKPALFRTRVEKTDVPPMGANKLRFKAPDTKTQVAGFTMNRRLWAYFPEATAPEPSKLPAGVDVVVSGKIWRCDFTTKGGLRLNIDLQQSKLESQ